MGTAANGNLDWDRMSILERVKALRENHSWGIHGPAFNGEVFMPGSHRDALVAAVEAAIELSEAYPDEKEIQHYLRPVLEPLTTRPS